MFRVLFISLFLAIFSLSSGQSSDESTVPPGSQVPVTVTERGSATLVAPGITVIIDPVTRDPLVLAEEIYFHPHFLEPIIAFDQEFTTFTLELASKVPTRILIEGSDGQNLVLRTDEVVVPAGARISVGFAAFAEHAGVISLYNEEMQLLAQVPYQVRKQAQFEQTVSGFASASVATDFSDAAFSPVSLGVGYTVRERTTGIGAGIDFEFSTDGQLSGRGSVSGSYSW